MNENSSKSVNKLITICKSKKHWRFSKSIRLRFDTFGMFWTRELHHYKLQTHTFLLLNRRTSFKIWLQVEQRPTSVCFQQDPTVDYTFILHGCSTSQRCAVTVQHCHMWNAEDSNEKLSVFISEVSFPNKIGLNLHKPLSVQLLKIQVLLGSWDCRPV